MNLKLVPRFEGEVKYSGRTPADLPLHDVIAVVSITYPKKRYEIDLIQLLEQYPFVLRQHSILSRHGTYRDAVKAAWGWSRTYKAPLVNLSC